MQETGSEKQQGKLNAGGESYMKETGGPRVAYVEYICVIGIDRDVS